MSALRFDRIMFVLGVTLMLAITGCGGDATESASSSETEEHGDHHDDDRDDSPSASFSELVAKIDEQRQEIETAFANETPGNAHGSLHSIGHSIEDLTLAAADEKMAVDDQDSVKLAAESLMDSFGQIDKKMHGQEGATYDDVKEEIDNQMEILRGLVKEPEVDQ